MQDPGQSDHQNHQMGEGPVKQRLIRVLVYEGTPEFIQDCLTRRWLKGSYCLSKGMIREAIVGDFLETILEPEPESFSTPSGSPVEESDCFSALR